MSVLFPFPPEQIEPPLPDPIPESFYARPPTATGSKRPLGESALRLWTSNFPRRPAWKHVLIGIVGLIGVIFLVQTPRSAPLGFLGCLVLITLVLASDAWGLRHRLPLLGSQDPRVAAAGVGVMGAVVLAATILALLLSRHTSSSPEHITRLAAPPSQATESSTGGLTPSPTTTPSPAGRPTQRPNPAAITFVGAPLSAQRGQTVTLAVRTVPNTVCSIDTAYPYAPELDPATSDGAGAVSWTWRVSKHVQPGTWPITVSCRSSHASTQITVS